MRILIAVDGSEVALRAARYAIRLVGNLKKKPELILFYADEPLMTSVAAHLGLEGTASYHAENGEAAMRKAKAMFKRAKIDFQEHLSVGNPAVTIIKFAKASRCDLIIMGTHGRSPIKSVFLGSVASKILGSDTVPVLIVH